MFFFFCRSTQYHVVKNNCRPVAAHVFSAIIEEPSRFTSKFKLWKYSQLGITDRTSDNKPLGYQRLDRRGNHELKISPITPGEQPANPPPVQTPSRAFTTKAGSAPVVCGMRGLTLSAKS